MMIGTGDRTSTTGVNDVTKQPQADPSTTGAIHLGPNVHYPANLQTTTTYVTRANPWAGHFVLNDVYIHRNQRNDHRLHRKRTRDTGSVDERRVDVPNLEEYMKMYTPMDIFEMNRLSRMVSRTKNEQLPPNRGLEDRNTLEGSWEQVWAHLGRYVRFDTQQASLPCDTIYLRHSSEAGYQRRLRELMYNMAQHVLRNGSADGYDTSTIRSLLPKPIMQFYMFKDYKTWVEDGGYEKRSRTATTMNGRSGHYVSWSNVNMYAVPAQIRHEVYVETPQEIRRIETSELLPTPSAPAVAYTSGDYLHAVPDLRRLITMYYNDEQLEMNMTSFVLAGKYGILVSRSSDPRLTTSGNLGIITPLPYALIQEVNPDIMVDLFHGTDVDPAAALLMFWRCYELDWDTTDHPGPPFYWYNFADGTVEGLPQDAEREPKFDNNKPGRPLQSWCIRIWRPCSPTYTVAKSARRTYVRCKELINEALRRRGAVVKAHTSSTPMDVDVPTDNSTPRCMSSPQRAWLDCAVQALRPVLSEFYVHDPRTEDELVDWVRGLLARRRQMQRDIEDRDRKITLLQASSVGDTSSVECATGTASRTFPPPRPTTEDTGGTQTGRSDADRGAKSVTNGSDDGTSTHSRTIAALNRTVDTLQAEVRALKASRDKDIEDAVKDLQDKLDDVKDEFGVCMDENANYVGQIMRFEEAEQHQRELIEDLKRTRDQWYDASQKLQTNVVAYRARELELIDTVGSLGARLDLVRRGTNLTLTQLRDAANTYMETSAHVDNALETSKAALLTRIPHTNVTLPATNTSGDKSAAGESSQNHSDEGSPEGQGPEVPSGSQ